MDGYVEQILFAEDDFAELKVAINGLAERSIEPKKLKELILSQRVKMLKEITSLVSFYAKPSNIEVKSSHDSVLEQKLKERNEFLTEIADRVNTIYKTLKNSGPSTKKPNEESDERLEKIKVIEKDAKKAYDDERYEDFVRLKYLATEKIIERLYCKLFGSELEEGEEYASRMVEKIELKIGKNLSILAGLNKWRHVRNDIVHENEKITVEEANEAKAFFDKLNKKISAIYKKENSY